MLGLSVWEATVSFLKNQPIEIENSYRFRSWVLVHPVETVYGTLTAKLFREKKKETVNNDDYVCAYGHGAVPD